MDNKEIHLRTLLARVEAAAKRKQFYLYPDFLQQTLSHDFDAMDTVARIALQNSITAIFAQRDGFREKFPSARSTKEVTRK